MGYYESQQHRFSIKQKAHSLVTLLLIISLCVYLYVGANSAQEYIFSIFMSFTIIGTFVSFVDTSNNAELIFLFIEKVQKVIDEGKGTPQLKFTKKIKRMHKMSLELQCEESATMYEKVIQLMEKISKIVYFTIVGVSVPGFVIPKAIHSYLKYYTTNLEGDAFDLSMPMWYS